jgi:hypothetical protein
MTRTAPFLRMILHLRHILFTDALTFMSFPLRGKAGPAAGVPRAKTAIGLGR